MLVEIENIFSGKVIFSAECLEIRACVEVAVKSGADLSGANLRGANLRGANLSDASLSCASLSGARLSGANLSDASLSGANLSGANLRGADLSDASLCDASLRDASLRDANLSDASLMGANLSGASLSGANLSGASLPKIAKIENLFTKILEAINNGGNLEMESWHRCDTTHCIAGWVVSIAGDAGIVAENLLGTSAAGALVINESCPYLEGKVPDFHTDNETGMAFIKQCAEKEKELLQHD